MASNICRTLAVGGVDVTVGANITAIAPAHFGGGGSRITLTGVGFLEAGAMTVKVDGSACIAPAGAADIVVSSTQAVCVVRRCRLTVSKPVLKAPMVSGLETIIS